MFAVVLILAFVEAASAQSPIRTAVPRAAPALDQRPVVEGEEAARQMDEIAMLRRSLERLHQADAERAARLDALTAEFETLAGELATLRSWTEFTCVLIERGPSGAAWASQNGDGVTEDCDGYACAAIDGRCYRDCVSTDECASGYACDIANRRCVLPPSGDS